MSSVEFDLSELENWAENVKNILKLELNAFLEESARELSYEFIARVMNRTPVGNYDGDVEFTTNPQEKTKEVSFKTKDGKHVFFIAKNPPKAVKFKSKLDGKEGGTLKNSWKIYDTKRSSDSISVTIKNNLEYASHVEYGHVIRNKKGGPAKGFVKGKHMLKNTEIEMTFESPEILGKAYERFLKRVMQ